MNKLDVYYRAWSDYRANTTKDRECGAFRRSVSRADTKSESLTVFRNVCEVEEDWIAEIEKGLVYIEKAIKEERQFIYSNGEVLPIERVKRVSKDSVGHLARHSDLITREQKGDDIIPDKLYSVERLNDYTVYENKFLYMLLCYLRDFVGVRYDKILELSNKYDGSLTLDKTVVSLSHKVSYKIELREQRNNDKYLRDHNGAKEIIDRIDLILKSVLALLATPLMEEQAKVAMIRPPITKTNVLKMDNNFKAAVELYEYVVAYDKAGYTVKPVNIEIAPFGDTIGDEIADVCALISFLTYEHGVGIEKALRSDYELEEIRRGEREIAEKDERLRATKRRLENSEISPEEYILSLEDQLKAIKTHMLSIDMFYKEIERFKSSVLALEDELAQSEEKIAQYAAGLAESERRAFEQAEALRRAHLEKLNETLAEHDRKVGELGARHNECMRDLAERMERQKKESDAAIAEAREKERESLARSEALVAKNNELADEMITLESRLLAVRIEQGICKPDENHSDKQSFEELESQLAAFTRYYEKQWGDAKKKIRKKHLSFKSLKQTLKEKETVADKSEDTVIDSAADTSETKNKQ